MLTKQCNKPLSKLEIGRYAKRRHDAKKPRKEVPSPKLHSGFIGYSAVDRTIKRNIKELALQCWKHARDDLKCPMAQWNNADSALLSRPAFNIYFGANVGTDEPKSLLDDCDSNEDDESPPRLVSKPKKNYGFATVNRPAYGFGTGTSSIGLNPRTMRINPIFPVMTKIMHHVAKVVMLLRPEWTNSLIRYPINFVGVKGYFSVWDGKKWVQKTCEWHRDVTHTLDGKPFKNNSQIPGTPVLILTYGGDKNLWFRRQLPKKVVVPDSLVHFRQKSGSLFLLDPRDEKPTATGEHWCHMSNMQQDESVTFSFSFRSVGMTAKCTPVGNLVNPEHYTDNRKDRKFREGAHKVQGEVYEQQKSELEKRLEEFLANFGS